MTIARLEKSECYIQGNNDIYDRRLRKYRKYLLPINSLKVSKTFRGVLLVVNHQ